MKIFVDCTKGVKKSNKMLYSETSERFRNLFGLKFITDPDINYQRQYQRFKCHTSSLDREIKTQFYDVNKKLVDWNKLTKKKLKIIPLMRIKEVSCITTNKINILTRLEKCIIHYI